MTVEELKAVLDEMPNECEVKIYDFDGEWVNISKIRLVKTFFQNGSEEIVEIHY